MIGELVSTWNEPKLHAWLMYNRWIGSGFVAIDPPVPTDHHYRLLHLEIDLFGLTPWNDQVFSKCRPTSRGHVTLYIWIVGDEFIL